MRTLALIPARGGSARIPGKNVRDFAGRPIMAWSIEAARTSGLFDRVVVSTDDEEIASVARSLGADVPFVRPDDLSDGITPMVDVVLHAVDELERQGESYDAVCTLFATAPFVRAEDLRAGHDVLASGAPAAVAVTEFDFPIFRAFSLGDDGTLAPRWPEHVATRSQDLPVALHDAGQFYWSTVEVLRESRSLWPAGMRPVHLPRHRVVDIDTPDDYRRAELMFQALTADDA